MKIPNVMTAEDAVKLIKSGDRVLIQGGSATPQALIKAMVARGPELKGVEICHIHTEGECGYIAPELRESFHTSAFFIGGNVRKMVGDTVDYIPIFLSDIPSLFRLGHMPLDVVLVNVSPPDQHGFCSLGVSVDIVLAGVEQGKTVIAQINPRMPRTFGDAQIHLRNFTACVEISEEIHEMKFVTPSDEEKAIGKNIAAIIEDGATLQMGIGGIPNAVLTYLTNHKNLGVHTEMFSEGIVDLVERGVVNGSQKKTNPYKIVSGFAMGTRRLYDFMDNNPEIEMRDIAYVNDTAIIRQNPKVTAINSAIEIDITGQVCADSIGSRMFSGVGGQMDFMRGAALSVGGKPIIAITSATQKGVSKIVPMLKHGAGVVTTRAHARFVATEYGVAELFGRTLKQRAQALRDIAHPEHREELDKAIFERFGSSLAIK
ncbi:acetyl-CoA hydrolase/transferase C-terminal domain-containing protein [uncultured Lutibacter sp.]|uniref:acetyl-CoA hydrolase/transferase family protein n=1 Tax=uncultured Lutibacter sp. TaxID=437739 RepID=UPI002627F0EC|nr:acetyl-CoA hydrolase/transferase C-terminal domain-containing protein [uncultured Lutibacter sp.]